MNRDEAIKLLMSGKAGIAEWNQRLRAGEGMPNLLAPELERRDLRSANLYAANLSGANLRHANLYSANLYEANLRGANLRHADLRGANLNGAHLNGAYLNGAYLNGAYLYGAKLDGANLNGAYLNGAYLRGANLSGAVLYGAYLNRADLLWADFSNAICGFTVFANVDLSEAKGLDSVIHKTPSTVGTDTLLRSKGKLPEAFLRGCGVPDALIEYLPTLLASMKPIQFYTCFISHSSIDKPFARHLFLRMRNEGLGVWFDEEDMKAGRELHPQIDEAIRLNDKFLLVLSEASMGSKWVKTEIRRARISEQREGRRKLFPIRLVDYGRIESWELPESSGEDLAEEVRKFYIPDFSEWKNHDPFEEAFTRLLRDLKADESTGANSD
jgi:TIR domain/Pentapeptide repeats (8 copies)